MHNLQNRLTSCRGAFRGREDSNGLLRGPCILLTMDINSDSRHEERKMRTVSVYSPQGVFNDQPQAPGLIGEPRKTHFNKKQKLMVSCQHQYITDRVGDIF